VTLGARLAIVLVRAYQLLLSPFLGGACRFEPSCSTYACGAIAEHGARRGIWLAVRRLARCHPFARPGFDPVPRHDQVESR
jgi:putative membrane protein insertion efficiency factor